MINDSPQSKLNKQSTQVSFQSDPQDKLAMNQRTGKLNSEAQGNWDRTNKQHQERPVDQEPGNPEMSAGNMILPDDPEDGWVMRQAKKLGRWYLDSKQEEYMGTQRSDERLEDPQAGSDPVPPVERKGPIPPGSQPAKQLPEPRVPQAPKKPQMPKMAPRAIPKPKGPGKPRFM